MTFETTVAGTAQNLIDLLDEALPYFVNKKWVSNRFPSHDSTIEAVEHLNDLLEKVNIASDLEGKRNF